MNQDKLIQFAASIVGIIALIVMLYLGFGEESIIVPVILAIIAGLTSFEGGRRKGRR